MEPKTNPGHTEVATPRINTVAPESRKKKFPCKAFKLYKDLLSKQSKEKRRGEGTRETVNQPHVEQTPAPNGVWSNIIKYQPIEARGLKKTVDEWKKITSDYTILDCVQHCRIEFTADMLPTQNYTPRGIRFNSQETETINSELNNLLEKGVIRASKYEK